METRAHPTFRLGWRPAVAWRLGWMITSALVVETVVIGAAAVPPALLLQGAWALGRRPLLSTIVTCLAIAPAYCLFAVGLAVLSALSARLLGWRTPPDAEMPVAEVGWPLCDWARYLISTHIVRVLVGSVLRATPFWAFYMRLNGARLGRGVYVNSLHVVDHNLLEFDDYVVIGDGVHVSGHTVERGVIRTGRVRLGRGVTVGLDSVIGIGVEAGPGCQVGAMSLVPKFAKLEAGATYVGQPAVKVDRRAANGSA